eukprot:gene6213-12583_t
MIPNSLEACYVIKLVIDYLSKYSYRSSCLFLSSVLRMLSQEYIFDGRRKQKPNNMKEKKSRENYNISNKTQNEETVEIIVGTIVERLIEGNWFVAEVQKIGKSGLSLRYLDDGNTEDSVAEDEVRICEKDLKDMGAVKRQDTLIRPLLGLVEDDSEIRRTHQTKAVIHKDMDTDQAIIINGGENELAAGGGLRALRYLKK